MDAPRYHIMILVFHFPNDKRHGFFLLKLQCENLRVQGPFVPCLNWGTQTYREICGLDVLGQEAEGNCIRNDHGSSCRRLQRLEQVMDIS